MKKINKKQFRMLVFCIFIVSIPLNAQLPSDEKKGRKQEESELETQSKKVRVIVPEVTQNEKGEIQITVPSSTSEAYKTLLNLVSHSAKLKKMAKANANLLTAGQIIQLPRLSSSAIEAILDFASENILDKAQAIQKALEKYSTSALSYIIQAADYLEMETLLNTARQASCSLPLQKQSSEITIPEITDDEGMITIIVPETGSTAYGTLKKVIASSKTLKNMSEEHTSILLQGMAIPLAHLSLKAVQDIFNLANQNTLNQKKTIQSYSLIDLAYLAQTANYLDMPALLNATVLLLSEQLMDPNKLALINTDTNLINQLTTILGPDLEKLISNRIIKANHYFRQIRVLKDHTGSVRDLAFNQDGSKLVSGGNDKLAIVWNWVTGGVLKKLSETAQDVMGYITSIAFRPASTQLAIGSENGSIAIYDDNGERLFNIEPESDETSVSSLAFSPNGILLAIGWSNHGISILNLLSQELKYLPELESSTEPKIIFINNNILAAASPEGSVILWDISNNKKLNTLESGASKEKYVNKDDISSIAYNPLVQKLSVAQANQAIVWDPFPNMGKELQIFKDPFDNNRQVTRAMLSPDGTLLAVASTYAITVWNFINRKKQILVSGYSEKFKHFFPPIALAFTPDNNVLATAPTTQKEITLWQSDAAKLKLLSFRQLLIFLIAKELGINQLSQDVNTEFGQLPENVKNLAEKK
ncbi:hypothetical protein HYX58_00480 [Candidatus Dependentiae bacterium]|nr:hypothetical protein [Candidatus Dependentiae bacterium]